jgi:FtsH-binding integral membrane protein
MTTPAKPQSGSSPSELTAGFLAVLSMVGSALGLVYQPVKVLPFAFLIALIATGMAPRDSKLPLAAIMFGAICFVGGLTIAVTTNHRLY